MKSNLRSRLAILLSVVSLVVCCTPARHSGTGQPPGALKRIDGATVRVDKLEAAITRSMEKANVAGLSVAIINDSRIAYTRAFGVRDRAAGIPFDEETVTGAASLSKTVFAYLVMLLIEEGSIDLDKPLHAYLSRPLPEYPNYAELAGDDRWKHITARMALSHSTGFPNWRILTREKRLTFRFQPGTRHSYSGEGVALLQMVVEEITGTDLETLARTKVFEPLGMFHTSYVWQEDFENNAARPHDQFGRPRRLPRHTKSDAAGSMVTTATDYARFLTAILNATARRKATVDEMLRPQIAVTSETMGDPSPSRDTNQYRGIHLAWSLGWGRFETRYGSAFFHAGHDLGYQNYAVTFADRGIGVVLLSNSDNFESVAREIVEAAIGDRYSPFDWLEYVPFDPATLKTPPPEPVAIDVDPAILRAYGGAYELSSSMALQVKVQAGKVWISRDGQQWARMYAESEVRFFSSEEDVRVSFTKDAGGKVTGLDLEVFGAVLTARKVR